MSSAEGISPEVHADNSVTFRIFAPSAGKVSLIGVGEPMAMCKEADGYWSITSDRLSPGCYFYYFDVDGVLTVDARNPHVKPYAPSLSVLEIVGADPSPWDIRQVEHGSVSKHWYTSEQLNTVRRFHVYTPPGYSGSNESYPVLYLLHGWGDDDSGWVDTGRANFILDNLLADGKIVPMVVVMPDGHVYDPFAPGVSIPEDDETHQRILNAYQNELHTYVMPKAESLYRVKATRESRAIAGLSMGGWQSLVVGLTNTNLFSSIGAFSTGVATADQISKSLPSDPETLNSLMGLIWLSCGTADALYPQSEGLHKIFATGGVKHTWLSTPGAHLWQVWREHLTGFLPLLFR
jgi:enterochelin esterase family protein